MDVLISRHKKGRVVLEERSGYLRAEMDYSKEH